MTRFALALAALVSAHAAPLALMPLPAKMAIAPGRLRIDSSFRVAIAGYSDSRLLRAVDRFTARVARQTGIPLVPGPAAVLEVTCRERGGDPPELGEDESYLLDVAPTAARLEARTVTGILRGLETFSQLIVPGPDGFQVPAVHIEDRPRFPWRGLMLDVSRHWMPVPVVERNLDAMAAVKLNVFHWHLSDDQGFRVESKRFPRLQEMGSDGNFYTQAEIRRVVAYARDRGIRVVPEFDMPGHTTAWLAGYPELGSAPGPYSIERKWGVFEPVLDPTREETYSFLDAFIGEMAGLFPDRYFHIGGDEVEDAQWQRSPSIQAFARAHHLATSRDVQAYFNHRLQNILNQHGKAMIGWDEVLAPDVAPGAVIQSWRGPASLAEAAARGYGAILSFGYYLDRLEPAAAHYRVDPLDGAARDLTPQQAAHILGGEACMWSEYVSAETVDSRLWPRLAAIAERLWSPRETTDADSMYQRLARISRWLEWSGVEHRAYTGPMLDRLAGGSAAPALRVLATVSEALGIEGRRNLNENASLAPLNRFVDAVPPESERVRELEQTVKTLAAHPAAIPELRATFAEWAENESRLTPLAEGNALLEEVLPLARNLSAAGKIGLRALELIEAGQPARQGWVAEQLSALDGCEKSEAHVRLAAVRPVRALVNSVPRAAVAQIRSQTLETRSVRLRNERPYNAAATVWNWTAAWAGSSITLKPMLWAVGVGVPQDATPPDKTANR